jgi:hypothetical protein
MERYPISGLLKSHTPSARQRITNWMNQNMFGDTRQGQGKAERLMGVMDYTPLGVGTAAYDVGHSAASGDWLGAGLNLAMAAAPGPSMKKIPIFRGEYSGNKGGNFYSSDREWSRQFTQSGQDKEIISAFLDEGDVFVPPAPVYAGNPDAVDAAIAEARAQGKRAVKLSEGAGEPDSFFVFDKSGLKRK